MPPAYRIRWYRLRRLLAELRGFDTTHPASVQHWIETNRWLKPHEIEEI